MKKDKDNPIDWSGFDPKQSQQPKSNSMLLVLAGVAAFIVIVALVVIGGCTAASVLFSH